MTFGATKVDGERTPSTSRRRKLRPLIITMGGARKEYMEQLFATMKDDFETPVFSPGIPSRSLRNRHEFLTTAFEVGLVPNKKEDEEVIMMSSYITRESYGRKPKL